MLVGLREAFREPIPGFWNCSKRKRLLIEGHLEFLKWIKLIKEFAQTEKEEVMPSFNRYLLDYLLAEADRFFYGIFA